MQCDLIVPARLCRKLAEWSPKNAHTVVMGFQRKEEKWRPGVGRAAWGSAQTGVPVPMLQVPLTILHCLPNKCSAFRDEDIGVQRGLSHLPKCPQQSLPAGFQS